MDEGFTLQQLLKKSMADDVGIPSLNPQRPPAYNYFDRSVDSNPAAQQGGGGGGITPPMWLSKVDSTHVIVSSATVNGFVPTNIASNLSISSDATWNIYLDATVGSTTGTVTAVTVTASTSAVPADSSTHSYRLIGTTVRASGSITVTSPMLAWSQEFVACTAGDPTTYHWIVS